MPYKRIDLIAAAFRAMPERELTIIGEGPERARIEAAAGPNVKLLGYLPDDERDAPLPVRARSSSPRTRTSVSHRSRRSRSALP